MYYLKLQKLNGSWNAKYKNKASDESLIVDSLPASLITKLDAIFTAETLALTVDQEIVFNIRQYAEDNTYRHGVINYREGGVHKFVNGMNGSLSLTPTELTAVSS